MTESALKTGVSIHPTAHVDSSVVCGVGVTIGPFCCVTGNVILGDAVQLVSHVSLAGPTKTSVGEQTVIYPFAAIGHNPQDLKYKGEPSVVEIGSFNRIREYVTIQPGTESGGMITSVGDHCLLMGGVHIAHDVRIGNRVILANYATLAGHVTVGDHAIVGGLSGIHQFVRIGHHAVIGGMSAVEHDVIPYGAVKGERANLYGLNLIGLRRLGFDRETLNTLQEAYDGIFSGNGTLAERVSQLDTHSQGNPHVKDILDFIRADSARALLTPRLG